jgi:nucleoside-diphosphate-sugar epimerase
MKGCNAVIHTAAMAGFGNSFEPFYQTNVMGTQHVIKACIEAGIPYLVYTSSASVVIRGSVTGGDERMPYPDQFDAYYPKSKALAEQEVLSANGSRLAACSLRPHLIWGPGDSQILPRLIERHQKGNLRLPDHGKYLIDTIYVDNAAFAHIQALKKILQQPDQVAGKAFFISQDEPITIAAFLNGLFDACGLPPVKKSIHPQLAMFLAGLVENVFRLFNIQKEPPYTRYIISQLTCPHWFDISRAKNDIGYYPDVSITEGLRRLKLFMQKGRS